MDLIDLYGLKIDDRLIVLSCVALRYASGYSAKCSSQAIPINEKTLEVSLECRSDIGLHILRSPPSKFIVHSIIGLNIQLDMGEYAIALRLVMKH